VLAVRVFAQSVLSTRYRLVIDLGDLLRADIPAVLIGCGAGRDACTRLFADQPAVPLDG
jgi:hypothetical protein